MSSRTRADLIRISNLQKHTTYAFPISPEPTTLPCEAHACQPSMSVRPLAAKRLLVDRAADRPCHVTGAKAVIDVYDGDTGRAPVQHRQERCESRKSGPIANAGRDGNDGRVGQTGYDARESAVHARDDDENVGFRQSVAMR